MRVLIFLAALCVATGASAQAVHERLYGVSTSIDFVLFNTDGSLDVDEVDGGAEVSLICDEAAAATATNDFVDEGSHYSIDLTAGEMECGRLVIEIGATDTNVVIVDTYGDLNAVQKGRGMASGVAQSGTATTIVLDGDTNIADDFLGDAAAAAGGATICLVGGTGAGQCRVISDWTQTSDTAAVPAWETNPDSTSEYLVLPTNQAITEVNASGEVTATITAPSEPSTIPTWGTTTGEDLLAYIAAWYRNEVQQTSTTKTLRNDADDGNLVTCAVSDNGTTFQIDECQ